MVIDDVVAGIGEIRRHILRPPARTPVEFEIAGVTPEYLHDPAECLDVVGLVPSREPGHLGQIHLPAEPDDSLRMRSGNGARRGLEFSIVLAVGNVGERRFLHRQRDRPDHVARRVELVPDTRHPAQFGEILPACLAIEVDAEHRGRLLVEPFFPGLQRVLAPGCAPIDKGACEPCGIGKRARGGIGTSMRQEQHGHDEGRQKQHQTPRAPLLAWVPHRTDC